MRCSTSALDAAVSQNHLRAQPLTPATVDRMNLDRSLAFYKDRFADASDFVFVFVGSFDLQTMRPLVEKYLGSLPSLRRNEDGERRRHASSVRHRREAGARAASPRAVRSASSSPGRSRTTSSTA